MLRDHPCATRNVFPAVAVGFCLFGIIFSEVKGEAVASMYSVTYPKREDPAFWVSVRVFTVEHRHFIDRVVLSNSIYSNRIYRNGIVVSVSLIEFLSIDCLSYARENTALVDRPKVWKQKRTVEATRNNVRKSFNSGWSNWMKSKNGATVVMSPLANIWRLNKRQIHVAMASCVWLLISLPLFLVSCSRRLQVFELEKYFLGSSTSKRSRIKIRQLASPLCVSRHGLDA